MPQHSLTVCAVRVSVRGAAGRVVRTSGGMSALGLHLHAGRCTAHPEERLESAGPPWMLAAFAPSTATKRAPEEAKMVEIVNVL